MMAYYNSPYMQPYGGSYPQFGSPNPQYPQFNPQSAPQQQQGNGILWVCGEAGAKAWSVAQGQSVMLMDSENPVLYLKSADMSGVPSMRIFDLVERNNAKPARAPAPAVQQIDTSQFVTRKEFEELRASITTKREAKRSNAESSV